MITRPHPRKTLPPELAAAQADFTSEGAPPPGKVANAPPALPLATTTARRVAVKPPTRRKGPTPAGRHRW